MDDKGLLMVNYSPKSVALLIEQDGAITEELTEIGGKFCKGLKCGPGWIFSRRKSHERLTGLLDFYGIDYCIKELNELPGVDKGGGRTPDGSGNGKQDLPGYFLTDDERREYFKEIALTQQEYYFKKYPIVVRLTGGECVLIGKNDLQTGFWFPDEGHDEEIDWVRNHKEEYLINENTKVYNCKIAALKGEEIDGYQRYAWLSNCSCKGQYNEWGIDRSRINPQLSNAIEMLDWNERELAGKGLYKKISEEDRWRLIAGYIRAIDLTEKRCRTWLKRYGVEKIQVNTYWADR